MYMLLIVCIFSLLHIFQYFVKILPNYDIMFIQKLNNYNHIDDNFVLSASVTVKGVREN